MTRLQRAMHAKLMETQQRKRETRDDLVVKERAGGGKGDYMHLTYVAP